MEIHGLDKADFAALMQEPVSSPERTSKRQVIKAFASKLKRSTTKRGSPGVRSHKSQLLDVPSVVVESQPNILAEWGSKRSTELPRPSRDSVVGQYYVGNIAKPSHNSPRSSPKQLSHEDLVNYFAGAPEFEIRSLRPRVSYRWKLDEESGEPQDFVDVSHRTFEAATLRRRERTRQLRDLVAEDAEGQIPMMEVPNMLSLNGNEPGTIGLEYFLQMPLADSKRCAEDEDEAFQAKRQLLATSPEDLELRPLNLEYLIHRLREIGDSRHPRSTDEHHERKRGNRTADELHTELFSNLLVEPEREEDDPPFTNLEGQVVALARVLVTTKTWYDFSLVEHRIRLGQILWPSTDYDDESANDVEDPATPSERDILLLQIALACELLIRVELSGFPTSGFSRKLRWDLVLAQRFLDSINIAPKTSAEDESPCRNSFMSIASFVTARESLDEPRTEPIMFPRHEKRQVAGLLRFAEALAWPHTEEIQERFAERVRRHSRDAGRFGVYGAALGTPSQVLAQSNYFAQQKRPQVGRTATAQSLQLLPASAYGADAFDLGGWLSRSWLTGFVLPGESTSHLLISTLLENSPSAVAALGDAANLYQGFVYKSRSYWSKSCVVGRVIAAANGATDCMGWISCSSAPVDQRDGWANLEVKDLPNSATPRISDSTVLAADSAFIPDEKITVTDTEFTWPVDGFTVLGNETQYLGFSLLPTGTSFELSAAVASDELSPNDAHLAPIPTSVACLEFSAKRNSSSRPPTKVTLPLLYDVHFISATPCFPNISRPSTPATTTSTSKSRSRSGTEALSKELPAPPTHPLHCSYAVEIIPAATILADDFTDTVHLGDETVVLDCRGTGELQLLARAWCAKVGENAVVGRVGKTCLGCCVREARGLGVKVVIRI
ncbi:hypothetical protein M436DRAFT_47721 [Aureobasidium namibiae CBS 147.97]|uniref:Uncharacterized protein n=1 Tax=Aureobasidium namibiae CBS 147.97 TaxID=1043004 RepID=A0A074XDR9_9PEZI|nr:uncharacterized protein M436DRAFT_47721 [Aureobasidium namibiae CBS 147.97]KEQ72771.1 hypothetical protein M436DRAFT_47721 [Aureobasidium namibiae CBS 147.97]